MVVGIEKFCVEFSDSLVEIGLILDFVERCDFGWWCCFWILSRGEADAEKKPTAGNQVDCDFHKRFSRSNGSKAEPTGSIRSPVRECSARCDFAYNGWALSKTNRLEDLRVVLVRTRNPLNIGAAARAMSNFGALHLRLVKPYEKAFREAVSAVGAAPLLDKAEELQTVEEAVRDCGSVVGTTAIGHRELQHDVYSLEDAAKKIQQKLTVGRVAILFGSEKTGLSNQDLSHCHFLLRIPTRVEHRSMNLAQAVAVVVYELARSSLTLGAKSKLARSLADMESIDRINATLLETLHASGYIHPRSVAGAEEKLRRMLRRFEISSADAEVLLGMLRKMLWKIKTGNTG
jgi:TrmH family RNA methyltransferase